MTPNYSAVLDFDYQLRRHGLLPSNNYSQSPTKQLRDDAYFQDIINQAKEIAEKNDANAEFVQKRLRIKKKVPGEHSADDPISNPESRFKVEVFFKSLDTLTSQMHERFKNFHSNFKNFVCLQPESYEKVGSSDLLKELIELYKDDIDSSDDVLQEYNLLCNMFRMWKREDTQNLPRTTGKVLKYLNDKNLIHVFPNIVTLIRIYLTIPASSASAERSFSRLKLIQ